MYFFPKKSESSEKRFLWHFQKANKVAIKTVAIKTVMECIQIKNYELLPENAYFRFFN